MGKKTSSIAEDLHLHVMFHLESVEGFETAALDIDHFMVATFGDHQTLASVDVAHLEVTYRLRKPLVASEAEHEFFFKNLRELFALYKQLNPHFTEFSREGRP